MLSEVKIEQSAAKIERRRCRDIAKVVMEYFGYPTSASAAAELVGRFIIDGLSANDVKERLLEIRAYNSKKPR